MNDTRNTAPKPNAAVESIPRFGSDCMAEMLRALEIPYIALTPGASFRGLHDSLVNYLGNERPELLLCIHEETAVAIAHGYARVTGRPLAVALHANVGLMHATMAIFNAWCDRIPMLMLGGVGPMDAVARRPWVDWIHTSSDMAALVRDYTKWDDQPASVTAALESILRGYRIATTAPQGPVYVCLDAGLQEAAIASPPPLPPLDRYPAPRVVDPPPQAVAEIASMLAQAERPLFLIGRVANDRESFARRVELAERLGARVITDLKTAASFPMPHPLHPFPAGIYISAEAGALVREADVIVSLDWVDLAGSLRQACGGQLPDAKVIQCSLDSYLHRGWSKDYQSLPPADVFVLADPDRLVSALLTCIGASPRAATKSAATLPASSATEAAPNPTRSDARISIADMARVTSASLAAHHPSYVRLPLGWPGEYCRFAEPLDFIGFDGGGGIGSGPGMTVGAALALRGAGRLPVAVLGDGDYLMGLTALWTGVHYRIPLLIVVSNNQSFFNDELHQERMARMRGRPIENRWVGLRMDDPPLDLATLARGQGAIGYGPICDTAALQVALDAAIRDVKAGGACVVDVRVAPEYARTVSSTLLQHIPNDKDKRA
ncbi:MAG TPA: thiamine pyrophosphate-binding protein [Casimicrobiaceae bacterium]|jgi:thiamine pyrophosphate-dependent acetolactate synthase large subunit-like protein